MLPTSVRVRRAGPAAAFIAALFAVAPALAVPNTFTYQGSLEENGTPVTGTHSVELRLVSEDGSTVHWTSGPQSVDIVNGLYRVDIAPSGLDWSTPDLFIETAVNGTTLLPRERITSTFFAQMAKELAPGAQVTELAPGAVATGGLTVSGAPLNVDEGANNAPGLHFSGDPDTGLYHPSENAIGTVTGGVIRLGITNNWIESYIQHQFASGSPSAPSIAWSADPDTGLYWPPSQGTIGFASNGRPRMVIGANDIDFYGRGVPSQHHLYDWGASNQAWRTIWARDGAVVTSSSKHKRDIRELRFDGNGPTLAALAPNRRRGDPDGKAYLNGKKRLGAGDLHRVSIPRGILFKWKDEEGKPTDHDVIGFMGDDLPIEAHAIRADGTRDPDKYYTTAVIGILAAKLRALEQEVAGLKAGARRNGPSETSPR